MAKKNKSQKVVVGTQSFWDGRLLTLIGITLLAILIIAIFVGVGVGIAFAIGSFNGIEHGEITNRSSFVIGIAAIAIFSVIGACWASILFIRWVTNHTVISGRRLSFNGNTVNLLFNMIKWTFLSIITLGIYSLWLPIKIKQWEVSHTTSEPEADEAGFAVPEVTYYYDDED